MRAKELVDAGALGDVFLVKQAEMHDGPHAPWFWDVERSGGGVALDMGCHAIEFFRWVLGKPAIRSVYAQMNTHVHGDKTRGDDHSIIVLEFDGGAVGMAEESWAKPGGMEDRAEIYGSRGVSYIDLLRGSSILTYSNAGYDYAVEKSGGTTGWTFTMYEEIWNYGFPQELQHFVDVLRGTAEPIETAADGRAVLEAVFAAYASAGSGRKIELPFRTDADKPIDLWRPPRVSRRRSPTIHSRRAQAVGWAPVPSLNGRVSQLSGRRRISFVSFVSFCSILHLQMSSSRLSIDLEPSVPFFVFRQTRVGFRSTWNLIDSARFPRRMSPNESSKTRKARDLARARR